MPEMDLSRLFDDLVECVPEAEHVLMLSRAGRVLAASSALAGEKSERLAVVSAELYRLARDAAEYLTVGQVRQITIEALGKLLFVTSAGENGSLAVVTTAGADLRVVAYKMAVAAKRIVGPMPFADSVPSLR